MGTMRGEVAENIFAPMLETMFTSQIRCENCKWSLNWVQLSQIPIGSAYITQSRELQADWLILENKQIVVG